MKSLAIGEEVAILESIDKSENYLKANYKNHCAYDDNCASHCISHGLSHPNDKELQSKCNMAHDRYCPECLNLIQCISTLKLKAVQLPKSHANEVSQWEINNASTKVTEWQKHVLRGVQQSKARSSAFSLLGPTTALWIRDYAQKVLPSKVISH